MTYTSLIIFSINKKLNNNNNNNSNIDSPPKLDKNNNKFKTNKFPFLSFSKMKGNKYKRIIDSEDQ